jgi:hypothetical protein
MGAGGREVRFREVLARWPVLTEDWARMLEARRTQADASHLPAAARSGANAPNAGNAPLEPINDTVGSPGDHDADAVGRRRAAD